MICPNRQCPDYLRTGVPAEYRQGVVQCPKCDWNLIALQPETEEQEPEELPSEHPPEPVPTITSSDVPGAVSIETFPSYELARFAGERLMAAGLHPVLLAHALQGLPSLPAQIYTPTRLTVPEEEADDAPLS